MDKTEQLYDIENVLNLVRIFIISICVIKYYF